MIFPRFEKDATRFTYNKNNGSSAYAEDDKIKRHGITKDKDGRVSLTLLLKAGTTRRMTSQKRDDSSFFNCQFLGPVSSTLI